MNCEPFLCIGGLEVGNALRTLTYLRRGLGGPRFFVRTRTPLLGFTSSHTEVIGDTYSDTYDDAYAGQVITVPDDDEWTPANLACYCSAYDSSKETLGGGWVSPVEDPAPWHEALRPESDDFLGFVPAAVTTHPAVRRAATPGQLGSSLGPAAAAGQRLVVSGTLYAASRAGMAYGERWLLDVVAGRLCEEPADALVLPACPPEGAEPEWRTLPRVGLVDDVVFQPIQDIPACLIQPVSFQMVSESPWLLADPELVALDGGLGARTWWHISTAEWVGDAALRITALAGSSAGFNLAFALAPSPTCPPQGERDCWSCAVPFLPAGHRLVIDGVSRTVEVSNPATGETVGGLDFLRYTPPFSFPELAPCSSYCCSAAAAPAFDGTVSIELVRREL